KTAFELLTAKRDYLENTLVIIDPCINPDGRDRYVNWYNQTKNNRIQPDPNSAEHFEPWHSGRTNHYVFDLNRDWVWMTQVESQARLPQYQKWQPQIHVDFHEQGVDQPYYFAPAAEPLHEVITDFQKQFQDEIGRNHAKYFDANGWLYFTKERFDLLYPSYGDTYPTYHGAIGMTYEQGGSGRAGLAIRNSDGNLLTLKDRIAHHFTTGISTVEMAYKNGKRLQKEMANFVQEGLEDPKTYVLSGNADNLKALTQLLEKHQITYGRGKGSLVSGYDYRTQTQKRIKADENSLIIPAGQVKNKLIHVLFEPNTKLNDSITYDITAWSLPFAYDVNALLSAKKVPFSKTESVHTPTPISKDAYAYVMDYQGFASQKALAALLDRGMTVRTSYSDFKVDGTSFHAGASILLAAENKNLENALAEISEEFEVEFKGVSTGFVDSGKDFGSPSVTKTNAVKVALFKGEGISSYNFGEWWYFLENDLNYPVTVLNTEYLGYYDLDNYDVLIMPDGNYRNFEDHTLSTIEKWVSNGGKLIAQSGALGALSRHGSFHIKTKEGNRPSTDPLLPYELQEREGI
ncbi:MAG: M14 family metallopeptidase, partial [Flavobacteriaceae bacterium]